MSKRKKLLRHISLKKATGNRQQAIVSESCFWESEVPTSTSGMFWVGYKSPSKTFCSLEFKLRNENNQVIYRTTFQITQSQGIVNFSLPKTAPPLEIGKQYQWVFRCEEVTIHGWVERKALVPAFNF